MRFLVTGASGLLGCWTSRALDAEGADLVRWNLSRAEPGCLLAQGCVSVDLVERDRVRAAFAEARPDVVLHLAAMSAMADCARDPDRARAVNATAVQTLADLSATARARLLVVSTDLVFDGEGAPYDEAKAAVPLSVYGRTKLEGEAFALSCPGALVVRASLLFGPALGSKTGFFDAQLGAFARGERIRLFDDEWRTPIALEAAARALVCLARSDATGIVHMGGPERMSRSEMGGRLARVVGADERCIMHVSRRSIAGEVRARDVSLDATRMRALVPELATAPAFEEACRQMLSSAGREQTPAMRGRSGPG